MSRYDQLGPLDDAPKPLGDRGFVGVNMRLDPAQLGPGYVSEAINMRFRNGVAETRKGFTVLPWLNKIVAGNATPWGEVHGTGIFSDPFTFQEYLVIAADGGVWYTQPNNVPQAMTLPAGTTITGRVEFSQAFDVLLMHRGTDEPTLVLTRITNAWTLVEQTRAGNGTYGIPNSTHSLFLQNRLFIPNDGDEIAVSDLNDYTRYVPVLQEFKVNQGSADELVAVFKFNDSTIIAFKEHSIYAISNVYGDLEALQQDELTSEFGLVARKSIAHVGKDLWFLSELGVMTIAQTEQNKLQGVVLPVSDPIQPLIDRINWRYAANAVSAVWDSKYYLAVPLDDAEVFGPERAPVNRAGGDVNVIVSTTAGRTYRYTEGAFDISLTNGTQTLTNSGDFVAQGVSVLIALNIVNEQPGSVMEVFKGVNNAVLVYDFLNGAWCGHDESSGFSFPQFRRFSFNNIVRLFVITDAGYLLLAEEDFEDQLPVPYATVGLLGVPDPAETIQVAGGTVVTTDAGANDNTATTWGIAGGLAPARTNLWEDEPIAFGYSPGAATPWTAPNTLPVPTATGLTFFSTNGVLPTVTVSSPGDWQIEYVNTQPITATLTTRGYMSEVLALDSFEWLTFDVQTWAPKTTVEVITSGVNEIATVLDEQTRSRTAYFEPSDATAFDVTNVNGDFLTPYRQDYSVLLGSGTAAGEAAELALYTITGGVPLGLHQEIRVTERIQASGRSAQVKFTNTEGRMRVMSVMLETNEDTFSAGAKA